MSARHRKPNGIAQQVVPLLLLGVGLVITNNSATFIDDEATILGVAANPLRTTLALFFSGAGKHEHPPLFDILLHFWLRWTEGNFDYLRIPSILFFYRGTFSFGPCQQLFHRVVWRNCSHMARGPMALRLPLRPSGDLVLVFVFLGCRFDSILFQISGRPDFRALGGILYLLRQFGLDKLFRLGNSRMSRDRSDSSRESQ